jgi:hypothetical protein
MKPTLLQLNPPDAQDALCNTTSPPLAAKYVHNFIYLKLPMRNSPPFAISRLVSTAPLPSVQPVPENRLLGR